VAGRMSMGMRVVFQETQALSYLLGFNIRLDFIQKDGGVFFDTIDFGVRILAFGFIQKARQTILDNLS
jgi:hypothetical protein